MNSDGFDSLAPEEQEIEIKKLSHKRMFIAFIILDAALLIYIIYSLISVFTQL